MYWTIRVYFLCERLDILYCFHTHVSFACNLMYAFHICLSVSISTVSVPSCFVHIKDLSTCSVHYSSACLSEKSLRAAVSFHACGVFAFSVLCTYYGCVCQSLWRVSELSCLPSHVRVSRCTCCAHYACSRVKSLGAISSL